MRYRSKTARIFAKRHSKCLIMLIHLYRLLLSEFEAASFVLSISDKLLLLVLACKTFSLSLSVLHVTTLSTMELQRSLISSSSCYSRSAWIFLISLKPSKLTCSQPPFSLSLFLLDYLSGSCTTQYLSDDPSPIYTSYSNLHLHLEQQRVLARDYLRSNPNFLSQLSQSEQVINPTNPPPRICSATDSELENLETAYEPQGQGPRIMVVGPEDSGKSTLIKFLANYALRSPAICDTVKKDKGKEKAKSEEDLDGHTGWWPTIVNLDPREVSRKRWRRGFLG